MATVSGTLQDKEQTTAVNIIRLHLDVSTLVDQQGCNVGLKSSEQHLYLNDAGQLQYHITNIKNVLFCVFIIFSAV